MIPIDSQNFESYVPTYDVAPKTWEEGRGFLIEQLRKMANAINVREIGFYLDMELLSGKAFIPGVNDNQAFRTVLRKVIVFGPLFAGTQSMPHGIFVDGNFTLIQLWASATNASTGRSVTFSNPNTIFMTSTGITIVSDNVYTRCHAIVEYMQEL